MPVKLFTTRRTGGAIPRAKCFLFLALLAAVAISGCVTPVQHGSDAVIEPPEWKRGDRWVWKMTHQDDERPASGTAEFHQEWHVVETEVPLGDQDVSWVLARPVRPGVSQHGPPMLLAFQPDVSLVGRTMTDEALLAEAREGDANCLVLDAARFNWDSLARPEMLRFPLYPGKQWSVESAGTLTVADVGPSAWVDVPAGRFMAIHLHLEHKVVQLPDPRLVHEATVGRLVERVVAEDLWYAPAAGVVVQQEQTDVSVFEDEAGTQSTRKRVESRVLVEHDSVEPDLGVGALRHVRDASGTASIPTYGLDIADLTSSIKGFNLSSHPEVSFSVHYAGGASSPMAGVAVEWDLYAPNRTVSPATNATEWTYRPTTLGDHEVRAKVLGAPAVVNSRCAEQIDRVPVDVLSASFPMSWQAGFRTSAVPGDLAERHVLAEVPLVPGASIWGGASMSKIFAGQGDEGVLRLVVEGEEFAVEGLRHWPDDAGHTMAQLVWDPTGPAGAPMLVGHEAEMFLQLQAPRG